MKNIEPIRIAVFASGRGSNLTAVLRSIEEGRLDARVVAVFSNNSEAGALQTARERGITAFHLSRRQFESDRVFEEKLLQALTKAGAELIVLAGYLKMMPEHVVRAFAGRMLNIHPALLPSFGGKGMYGHFVHEAVLAYGCKVSGVTVHLVDADYDTGAPVMQRCVSVLEGDTPETLAARVLEEEHRIYAEAIQLFAERRVVIDGRRVRILPAID